MTTPPRHPDVFVQLTGTDGNALSLLGKVTSALKRAGYSDDAETIVSEVFDAKSYDDALRILCSYVEVG